MWCALFYITPTIMLVSYSLNFIAKVEYYHLCLPYWREQWTATDEKEVKQCWKSLEMVFLAWFCVLEIMLSKVVHVSESDIVRNGFVLWDCYIYDVVRSRLRLGYHLDWARKSQRWSWKVWKIRSRAKRSRSRARKSACAEQSNENRRWSRGRWARKSRRKDRQ